MGSSSPPITAPASIGARAGTAGRVVRALVVATLILAGLLTFAYTGISVYIATRLVYQAPKPITKTPAAFGLAYRDVTFKSREDALAIHGWLIPGVLSNGSRTVERALIVVHGTRQNRTDPGAGVLDLSAAFARRGFAVLAFDMRGMGESAPAPLSFGAFEQRDVLGAVDFLRSDRQPYFTELGPVRAIGGWGVSMGGATLLLAAAHEPHIEAIVSDSAYADIAPLLEREVPKQGGVPALFTPGALLAGRPLYDIDYYGIRPVDGVGQIAPRPLYLIHGDADRYVPPANQDALYDAAVAAPHAQVSYWRVPGADHAQAFHTAGQEYVERVTAFFNTNLSTHAGTT